MKHSTFVRSLLTTAAALALMALPIPAFAQRGGGHGGGGGFHGGGGGFHGGGFSGGMHGGGFGGSRSGSFGVHHGGAGFGRRSSSGFSRSNSGASRPWASEGRGVRNSSPGWHSFERGNAGGATGRSGAAGRSGGTLTARNTGNMTRIADGNWHSFSGERSTSHTRSTTVNRAAFVGHNYGWRGYPWRAGWGFGWRRGWGWGGYWGWPGWNWGWGYGWGWRCCGWGWGYGWGWGWGLDFGLGWGPYWTWPPYAYDPSWYDDNLG